MIALKGFGLFAVRNWQEENKRPYSDIAKMKPEERVQAEQKVFDYLFVQLKKTLHNPKQDNLLKDGLDKPSNIGKKIIQKDKILSAFFRLFNTYQTLFNCLV